MRESRQPWIHSASLDSALILAPPFLAVLLAWFYRSDYGDSVQTPLVLWVVLIVGIDVAHVYGTLFRTYWNSSALQSQRQLYFWIPILAWLGGVFLYSFGALVFWRALAYLAVFHFVRQQYGLMRIYSRSERNSFKWIDAGLIYMATLYPLVYWHTHLPRNFNWFVEGDFWIGLPAFCEPLALWVYLSFALGFFCKEIIQWKRQGQISWPKQVLILGTALSWYLGIVQFNGDVIFTVVNVVSHGIPYLGLIWLLGRKEKKSEIVFFKWRPRDFFSHSKLPLFLAVLIFLAYLEEGLWDGFVWRERTGFFSVFSHLPAIQDPDTLMWLIPLLALPQSTHYLLDGFIWRRKNLAPDFASSISSRC